MNILVTSARAPVSVDIARVLLQAGHQVFTADCLKYPVGRFVPGLAGYLQYAAPVLDFERFERDVVALCTTHGIERVVPTSEEVFWLARVSGWPDGCQLLAPPLSSLLRLHHKGQFHHLATSLGYGAGPAFELATREDLAAFVAGHDCQEYVLKPVFSRFASQTLLGPEPARVRQLEVMPGNPWLAQPRVFGRELCVYNVARDGKLLLHVAYSPVWRAGKGASVYFEPVQHSELRRLSAKVASESSFTGQLSLDVIETANGLVALECNPRATSGVHLAVQASDAFARALLGDEAELPELAPRMLALPMVLFNGKALLTAKGRQNWAHARDVMCEASVGLVAQGLAMGEMLVRSVRAPGSLLSVTTSDIEWNLAIIDDFAGHQS